MIEKNKSFILLILFILSVYLPKNLKLLIVLIGISVYYFYTDNNKNEDYLDKIKYEWIDLQKLNKKYWKDFIIHVDRFIKIKLYIDDQLKSNVPHNDFLVLYQKLVDQKAYTINAFANISFSNSNVPINIDINNKKNDLDKYLTCVLDNYKEKVYKRFNHT
jgi:hypothetical protein